MSFDTSYCAAEATGQHVLDATKLAKYFIEALVGCTGSAEHLTVSKFKHGQSNPTYLLQLGHNQLVLRKQPHGKLLASAHAVDREYRVLSALASTAVPVPKPVCYCSDPSVVGTPFSTMAFVPGTIYTNPNLPGLSREGRAAVYNAAVEMLATLHSQDIANIKLQDFGQPADYCRRQVSRWSKQYVASMPQPCPAVLRLIDWLQQHVPAEDAAPPAPALVHGDYRLDNLVFGDKHQVLAVLDWELATLGNPWVDVAYLCLPYHLPPVMAGYCLQQPLPDGIPRPDTLLQQYCVVRGIAAPPADDWAFYMALSARVLARLAVSSSTLWYTLVSQILPLVFNALWPPLAT